MAVSKRLRFEIFRRDNHTCRYCGATPPGVKLTVDHVTPQALGGTDDPANLVTACDPCNSGKSAVPPEAAQVAQVADDAVRWAAAMKSAAAKALADFGRREADRETFRDAWEAWGWGEGDKRRTVPLPPQWAETVDRFVSLGLPLEILVDSIGIAMRRKTRKSTFDYLCGIAWNKLREIQEAAQAEFGGAPVDGDDEEWEPHEGCRAASREELAVELIHDVMQSRHDLFMLANDRARRAITARESIEGNEVVLTARYLIDELYESLAQRDAIIGDFLAKLPAKLRDLAVFEATEDFAKADMQPTDGEIPVHALRHVGYGIQQTLSGSSQPGNTE